MCSKGFLGELFVENQNSVRSVTSVFFLAFFCKYYGTSFVLLSKTKWSKFAEEDANEPKDVASHLLVWQLLTDIPGNPTG